MIRAPSPGDSGQFRRQQLDRDRAVEAHLAREIDHTHPTAAELAFEGVATGHRFLEGQEERVECGVGQGTWDTVLTSPDRLSGVRMVVDYSLADDRRNVEY